MSYMSVVDPGITILGAPFQRGRIRGVWELFRCPFTYTYVPYVFVVSVKNKIQSAHIACYSMKVYAY